MKRTKVLQFVYGLTDGGAETLVKDYASLIDKDKFDMQIVVFRVKEETANLKRVREANIPVVSIYKHWNLFTKACYLLAGKWYVPYVLNKIVQKHKADVLHTHLRILRIVQKIENKLEDVRLFYTCHNLPELFFGKGREEERKAAESLIKNKGLRLIALHDDMANELNGIFNINNTAVIRNAIDFKKFKDNSILKSTKRAELGIPEDAFVLGHVGRFAEQKNHQFLADVFSETVKLNSKAFLVMVGDGNTEPIKEKLNALGLSGRYIILSHRTDVNEIMKTMDVFVFPSIFEGLGIVMIEAQVSGLKCVASDAVPSEAFKTEKAISLPLGDAKHWAEVILDENAKGTPHGNLDDYDMNKEIKRLEKLYMGTLDD